MNPHTDYHLSKPRWIARLLALSLLLVGLGWAPAASASELDLHKLLTDLQNGDDGDRKSAAKKLRENGAPPAIAVGRLIAAARIETDVDALCEMLITLGESGMTEALGLIQTHARSPVKSLRNKARRALKAWMVRNRVMHPDAELPEPPHPYYDAPPHLPPDRPAGHALVVWQALPPGGLPDGPTLPQPYYEPPERDGLPDGYRVVSKPRKGLAIGGAATFAGLYIGTIAIAAGANSDDTALFAIPVAGPMIVSAELFEHTGDFAGLSRLAGAMLVLDGVGQLAGLSMLIAGLAAGQDHLERDGHAPMREAAVPEVTVSPTGMGLSWQF